MRAPRVDGLVADFTRRMLSDEAMLNDAIEAYQKKTITETPGFAGRLKTVESEIRLYEKRAENMLGRLADLPADISASTIYDEIRAIHAKTAESKTEKARLLDEKHKFESKELDTDALRLRVKRAVEILSQTPVEKQKAIFENLFQFIELHPTKMRIGFFAPIKAKTPESEQSARPPGPFFVSNVLDLVGSRGARDRSTAVCIGAQDKTRSSARVRVPLTTPPDHRVRSVILPV